MADESLNTCILASFILTKYTFVLYCMLLKNNYVYVHNSHIKKTLTNKSEVFRGQIKLYLVYNSIYLFTEARNSVSISSFK